MAIRGSCLCGEIAFEIDGEVSPIQVCYAGRCQKRTGSAYAPELACRTRDFRWVRGADNVVVYRAPLLHEPPALTVGFCRTCGSPVPVVESGSTRVDLLAGVLDGNPALRVFREIHVGAAPGWATKPFDCEPFHSSVPPGRRARWERR